MHSWAQLDLSNQSGDQELIQAWFLEGFAHGYEMAKNESIKPLDSDKIAEIYHGKDRFSPQGNFSYYGFVRDIEQEHGIK